MRTLVTLFTTSLLATSALAAQDCRVSAEDLSIMASVRPTASEHTQLAEAKEVPVLHGLVPQYGQLGEEDIAIMASVRPANARIVLYPPTRLSQK